MMMRITYFCVCVIGFVATAELSESNFGVPVGFLGDCPGVLKPAVIKPKTLEKLTLSILSPGNVLEANYTTYNYYHINKLAKHPEMDFGKRTAIVVSGYLDTINSPVGRAMATLYRELGYNALVMDHFQLTAHPYPQAVRVLRPTAIHMAEMLANLTKHGLDPKKTDLIGLSLGCQAISLTAKHYRHLTGQNISSLTAIDPSGPCYRALGPEERLAPSDADFVLQITTNMDGYGTPVAGGQVTVFVNGGEYQPAAIWFLPCLVLCSHVRSYFIWLAALMNPGIFVALQCDSVQQARDGNCYEREPRVTNTVDLFTDRTKPGIYYLATINRYPYGVGKRGLKRKNNDIFKHFNWLSQDDVLTV